MNIGYAIVGLIAGVVIAGAENYWLLGAFGGAAIGILFARLVELDRRIQRMESSARRSRRDSGSAWDKTTDSTIQEPVADVETSPWLETDAEAVAQHVEVPAVSEPSSHAAETSEHKQPIAGPSILQTLLGKATTWVTTGNVPVKVGVIITFFGASFLLKYAIDRKLFAMPLEFRLLAVAAVGVALLVIGWRLRNSNRVYALSLQGGGVGILFLTVFAALQIWHLLPPTPAFLILVVLAVLTAALAVQQNARMLAILGVIGGFLAPVLASTGQGNHVALFSYYLVLNCAVVGIAWFRAWRGLNLISWVFTFLVGSLWGYKYYRPDLLLSTQPFLVLHFLLYQAVAILFALRQPPRRIGIVDGMLVFGTPVIAFALQAALVEGIEDALALSAIIVAIFYTLTAFGLWRSKGEPLRLLVESYTALAVVFATIAIPLAFDARWTSAAWAAEGAALVWVGSRQARPLSILAGTLLVFLSGFAFVEYGWRSDAGLPLLNGNVLGGVMISVAALFASRTLELMDDLRFKRLQKLFCLLLFAWGVLWWLGIGWVEINDRVAFTDQAGHHDGIHVFLLFLALSLGAGAWLDRIRQWSKARRAAFLLLPLLIPIALATLWDHEHFLVHLGWLAWPVAWLVQAFVLRMMDDNDERLAPAWHFGSLLLLTIGLALEAAWWVDLVASSAWAAAAAVTVPGILALLVWRLGKQTLWPVSAQPSTYLTGSILLVASQVISLTLLSIDMSGNPAPWPYLPVLNPFDLAMLFAMAVSMQSLHELKGVTAGATDGAGRHQILQLLIPYKLLLAIAFFVLTTVALVRGVHHYTAIPWRAEALFDSVIVQTSLSVYWGLLGFTGMIWGARISHRSLWLTGAGFMALVVLKLFAVDLGNTGTVERIISFIAIGLLLLVVGYFAPAPPRAAQEKNTGSD